MDDPALTPLGRLHEALSDYAEAAEAHGISIRGAWGHALDATDSNVPSKLAALASELLPAVNRQIERSPNSFVGTVWAEHGSSWRAPLLHEGVSLDQPAVDLPAPNLTILGLAYTADLSAATEGASPTQEGLKEWINQLHELRALVADDDSLDVAFRGLLNRHIAALMDALEQWRRKGPAGVQTAANVVLGELVMHQVATNNKPKNATVAAVLGIVVGISAGVSNYPEFRAGVVAIAADTRHVTELIRGEAAADPATIPPVQPQDFVQPGEQEDPPAA